MPALGLQPDLVSSGARFLGRWSFSFFGGAGSDRGSGFWSSGFQGLGFRVSGFGVQGLGFGFLCGFKPGFITAL